MVILNFYSGEESWGSLNGRVGAGGDGGSDLYYLVVHGAFRQGDR